jgi:hypothetical protein
MFLQENGEKIKNLLPEDHDLSGIKLGAKIASLAGKQWNDLSEVKKQR